MIFTVLPFFLMFTRPVLSQSSTTDPWTTSLIITTTTTTVTTTTTNITYEDLGNETIQTKMYPDGAIWDAALIQRVATLAVIMVISLTGNVIIVSVLLIPRYRKRSSRVNIFILNLAVGDLAVCCITMSSELLFEVFGGWVLGAFACKAIVYAQIVTLASTTFILTSMTHDRYQAICRPLKSAGGVKQAKQMIGASWILAFIFALPQLFIFLQVEAGVTTTGKIRYECVSRGYTAQWQRKLYFTWLTAYILIIPFLCITFCYTGVLRAVWKAGRLQEQSTNPDGFALRRSMNAASTIPRAKIKTLKLTICIIASFVICWTPYFIVHNIRIYSDYTVVIPKNVMVGAETMALLNSALNPIFYGYFNVRVRRGFFEIVYRKKNLRFCTAAQSCSGALDSGDTAYSCTAVTNVAESKNKNDSFQLRTVVYRENMKNLNDVNNQTSTFENM